MNAAVADDVAVAIEEGHREVAAISPVALSRFEGGMASASITTEAATPSVMPSPASSKTILFQPRTRKRRKKMVMSSQSSAARKPAFQTVESMSESICSRRWRFLRGRFRWLAFWIGWFHVSNSRPRLPISAADAEYACNR